MMVANLLAEKGHGAENRLKQPVDSPSTSCHFGRQARQSVDLRNRLLPAANRKGAFRKKCLFSSSGQSIRIVFCYIDKNLAQL